MNSAGKVKQLIQFLLITGLLLACSYPPDKLPEGAHLQNISYRSNIQIDGDPGDWLPGNDWLRIYSDLSGRVPDSSDYSCRFMLAWDSAGILILAEIRDDAIYEDGNKYWNGDGMEFYISPEIGSFDILQTSVRPSYDLPGNQVAVNYYDHRRTDSIRGIEPTSEFCCSKRNGIYHLEGRIPFNLAGIEQPRLGDTIALQLYFNDSDMEDDSANFSLPWYPVRESYRNPYAFHAVQLVEKSNPENPPEIRAFFMDNEFLHINIFSDQQYGKKQLGLLTGELKKEVSLVPEIAGIYSCRLAFPADIFASGDARLFFLRKDSLYFSLHPCLIPRIYEHLPEPNRFEDEIRIFETIDCFNPPPENPVLFTGSSTIRKWEDIAGSFPDIPLINRGFGGSTMEDLNHYFHRVVSAYSPSRIFIYEGDNDIARGASPQIFIEECRKFIELCHKHCPDSEIYFISIKPSPARFKNWNEMKEANLMLSDLASVHEKVYFIDIGFMFLGDSGLPEPALFLKDRLHLNKYGYDSLIRALMPHVYK